MTTRPPVDEVHVRAPKQIWVATPYGENGLGGIDRLNDAVFEAFDARPELNIRCTRLVTRGKRGLLMAQGVFALALARLSVAAPRGKLDLLHIHLSGRGSIYRKVIVGLAARTFGIPYVVHLHDYRDPWDGTNAPLRRGLDLLYGDSTKVIVLGKHWAGVVLDRLPAIESKIIVLPNATTAAVGMKRPAAGRVAITFLGQLGARKGTPQLVTALGRLAHLKNWSATLAGDGDIDATCEQVRNEGISHRVKVPGWLEAQARTRLLHDTDILVLPSFAENLPMVVIEAFAHGIAVIATPVGAVPEVISHDVNGLLVPPGNVDSLASAIERLIDNCELRRALGRNAQRTHAERYELGKYIERLAEIWHQAIAEPT